MAIELDSTYIQAYRYRAWAYHDKGEYEKAIADYGNVIELDPNDANAYKYRADAYKKMAEEL